MTRWFEINPFGLVIAILLTVVVISQFVNNSVELMVAAGLFLGAAGFANSLWLNHRINRIQDVLCEKNLTELGDFKVSRHEPEE